MKTKYLIIIVLFVASGYFIFQDYFLSSHAGKGISVQSPGEFFFISHEDSFEYVKLAISPDYDLSHYNIVRDSMLSHDKVVLVDEFFFRGKALSRINDDVFDLHITARFFNNSDMLIFVKCSTEKLMEETMNLEFHFPLRAFENTHLWSLNYESLLKPTEMSDMISFMDQTSLHEQALVYPSTLHYIEWVSEYQQVNGSLLIGPGAVFHNKAINLRELQSSELNPVLELNKAELWMKVSIPVKLTQNQYQENWMMYSFRQLLDYRQEETSSSMLAADFNMRKKLSTDGIYHIAHSEHYAGASDETYDYYYNYASWEGQRFMSLYQKYPEQRFFYNFFINMVYTTVKAVNRYGVWISDVRSQYLWNTFQIPEGYIDTRYSTDAGFFLLRAYNEHQIPDAISAGMRIGDFLVEKMQQKDGIITGENGFFYFDYYHPSGKYTTHASLNHILMELNYLFELYLSTYKSNYLDAAEKIMTGIHETGKSWIRDQEWGRWRYDLWYAVISDEEKGLDFVLVDYTKTLTYYDLLRTQELIQTVYNRNDPIISDFIASKRKWFLREGIVPIK